MKKLLTLSILAILSLSGFAQEFKSTPYIDINAHADTLVVPDQIFLAITLKEREAGRDQVQLKEQEEAMKQGLLQLGIDLEKLSVANSNADYVDLKWSRNEVVSQRIFELELANAEELSKVLQLLDKIKVHDARIDRVEHSKEEEIQDAIERKAILKAKHKADLLLNVIGEETGSPLVIRHLNSTPVYRTDIALSSYADESAGSISKSKQSLNFRKIKYQASLYVKFSIKE